MTVVVVIHAPEEAEGLIRWGMLFALSMEDERLAVLHRSVIQAASIEAHIQRWEKDHQVVPELEIRCFGAEADEDTILDELRKPEVSLAVLGQNRFSSCGSEILAMNRKIFERAVCDSVLIRLSSRSVEECDTILIPSAGGPHSCLALKLGSRIASRFEGTITPLFVEPEIGDEDGQAVGLRILQRTIVEAGLDLNDSDHIQPEVVVSNVVEKGVYEASHRKSYDLILCGASNGLTVKRKLFGAIPPKMVDGDEGMALAVIRRRYPVSHRIRDSFERFFQLRIPQLERESRIALFDRLQTNSRWSFDFVFLMILATGIASFGLMQDSPAVVIGAMLVAPLMTPLLGSGLALVQGNLPLLRACLKSICLGFLAALLVGGFLGWTGPLGELTGELAGRGNPSLLDFGVAMLSGVAASYCVARPGLSSALAGVAIAAALVPPIATVGISLTLQEWTNAEGAALLFGTNVVTIILASCFTFFAIGIRGQTGNKQLWAHRAIALLLVLLVLLIIPLAATLLIRSASQS